MQQSQLSPAVCGFICFDFFNQGDMDAADDTVSGTSSVLHGVCSRGAPVALHPLVGGRRICAGGLCCRRRRSRRSWRRCCAVFSRQRQQIVLHCTFAAAVGAIQLCAG